LSPNEPTSPLPPVSVTAPDPTMPLSVILTSCPALAIPAADCTPLPPVIWTAPL